MIYLHKGTLIITDSYLPWLLQDDQFNAHAYFGKLTHDIRLCVLKLR